MEALRWRPMPGRSHTDRFLPRKGGCGSAVPPPLQGRLGATGLGPSSSPPRPLKSSHVRAAPLGRSGGGAVLVLSRFTEAGRAASASQPAARPGLPTRTKATTARRAVHPGSARAREATRGPRRGSERPRPRPPPFPARPDNAAGSREEKNVANGAPNRRRPLTSELR